MSIVALKKDEFIEAAWPLIGRKVAKYQVLSDIYETAGASIALPIATDSMALRMYLMVVKQMRQLIQHRYEIEQYAHDLLHDNPDYQKLRQLPGIGPIHALTILAEAGDLRRFAHYRQFLKFCGLDLAVFAPNSKYRALVTPARRGKGKKGKAAQQQQDQTPAEHRAAMTWAQRLKRVFSIDIETCAVCGSDVKVIASIEDPAVIKKILAHLDDHETFTATELLPQCRAPPTTLPPMGLLV